MYCTKCGRQLNEGDRFCSNCGNLVGEPLRHGSNSRQERWEGTVLKCPRCGREMDAYTERCPSCGYELREVGAVTSVKELATKIEFAKDDEIRAVLVRSFPIPNSREDIIEFLIMAVTNIDENAPYGTEEEEGLAKAWIAKADQALQKADLVIPSDKVYARSKATYEKKARAFEKALKKRGKRKAARVGMTENQTKSVTDTIQMIGILIAVVALMSLSLLLL